MKIQLKDQGMTYEKGKNTTDAMVTTSILFIRCHRCTGHNKIWCVAHPSSAWLQILHHSLICDQYPCFGERLKPNQI